jgi:acetyl-CoA carboxylase carboxyl transferase subunit alpha
MTAQDLQSLDIIDQVVAEPPGGAHTDHARMAGILNGTLKMALDELARLPAEQLLAQRYEKFRRMGRFFNEAGS